MVAPEHHRKDGMLMQIGHTLVDLVERFFDIRGDDGNVTRIHHIERFDQIHSHLEVVSGIERRDRPDRLGPEARSGAVGRTRVQRRPGEHHIGTPQRAHIVLEWHPQKRAGRGVFSGQRQIAAEQWNGAVGDRPGRFEPVFARLLDVFLAACGRYIGLRLEHLRALQLASVHGASLLCRPTGLPERKSPRPRPDFPMMSDRPWATRDRPPGSPAA